MCIEEWSDRQIFELGEWLLDKHVRENFRVTFIIACFACNLILFKFLSLLAKENFARETMFSLQKSKRHFFGKGFLHSLKATTIFLSPS